MKLIVKETDQLSVTELMNIFQERVKVFVVEQNCPYQEIDEFDINAKHVLLKDDNTIVAYTKIIEQEKGISFGRVLVTKKFRGKDYGRKIVQETIHYINRYSSGKQIHISAQAYLKEFYESFGFKAVSEIYLEDDIPHIDMLLNIESSF